MKQLKNTRSGSGVMGALGLAALLARWRLYAAPVDITGLLNRGNIWDPVILLVSLAALGMAVFFCSVQAGSDVYEDSFGSSALRFAGYTAAAAGILITVLLNVPLLPGRIGMVWKLLGYVSPVCLFLAGYASLQGKPAAFLLHAVPCAFLAVHLVDHYQLWCSDPQIQDYVFTLFATVALALFSYQLAAFDAGRGCRRKLVFWGLLAQFLCLGELAMSQSFYLYAGGFLWAAACLCTLRPREGGV